NIPAQDPLLPRKMRMHLARIFLAIEIDPNRKRQSRGKRASDSTEYSRDTQRQVKLHLLAIGPRQCRRIRACVRNHAIQHETWRSTCFAEFCFHDRQWLHRVTRVVGKSHVPNSLRFFLSADANHKRVLARLSSGMEHIDRPLSRSNHSVIVEGYPLVP